MRTRVYVQRVNHKYKARIGVWGIYYMHMKIVRPYVASGDGGGGGAAVAAAAASR